MALQLWHTYGAWGKVKVNITKTDLAQQHRTEAKDYNFNSLHIMFVG